MGKNWSGTKTNRIKNVLTIFIVCASVLLGTIPATAQEKDWSREEYKLLQKFKMARGPFEKGKELFLKENYKKAEDELSKCLEVMPEYAEADFYLSQIYYKQGNLEKASTHIEKAKKNYVFLIKMNLNREHQYLIQLRDQRENLNQAWSHLQSQLAKASAQEEQGKIQGQIWKVESDINIIDIEIRKYISEQKEIDELPANYFYHHGNILIRQNKFKEAYEQYQEAIRIDPKHGNAYNNLANLYFLSKQYEKAWDCLEKAEAYGATVNPKFKEAVQKALK